MESGRDTKVAQPVWQAMRQLAQLTHHWLQDLALGALDLPEGRHPVSMQLCLCRCNTYWT